MESGASKGVVLKGFLGYQMGLTPTKGRSEGERPWQPWADQSLKHRLVFHNNSQLRNEKFAAVLNCWLLLNHFPSFCLWLDI